jgi:hypothetical protein
VIINVIMRNKVREGWEISVLSTVVTEASMGRCYLSKDWKKGKAEGTENLRKENSR